MAVESEGSSWPHTVDDVYGEWTPPVRCSRHCCVVEQSIPEFRGGIVTMPSVVRAERHEVLDTYTFDPDAQSEG